MRRAFWLGFLATALIVVGCGGDGDSGDGDSQSAETPEGAVQAYLDSLHEKDFAAACSVFTEEALESTGLEGTGSVAGVSCEERLDGLHADDAATVYAEVELENVEETGTTAVVEMAEGSAEGSDSVTTISLVKEGSEWKIEGSSYEAGSV